MRRAVLVSFLNEAGDDLVDQRMYVPDRQRQACRESERGRRRECR